MNLPFKVSISTKLEFVILTILLAATVPLSFKSAEIFRNVSIKREESANLSHAKSKSHEVSMIFKNINDRASMMASMLIYTLKQRPESVEQALKASSSEDDDTLSMSFYSNENGPQKIKEFTNTDKITELKLPPDYLEDLERKNPFPLQRVLGGEHVLVNRSFNPILPIISIGIPLFKNESGSVSYFAVINMKQGAFQKIFSDLSERKSYLVGSDGIVLAHYNDALVVERKKVSMPLLTQALSSKLEQGAGSYTNPIDNKGYFGAFANTNIGPVVISEIPESIILEPSLMIKREVYYLTFMILSLSLLVVFLFSLTLTRPIIKLSNIANAIGRGRFDIPVSHLVSSSDEVGNLAVSIEAMLGGLKEREKAMSILNKFHGSTIAEDLLSSATLERQGLRKNIAILFCDIRGFTGMSEKLEPEEVVHMLNDYFNKMVPAIMKNNGVIDKFIGDAIMATWGAPQATGTEAYDAIRAALDMRLALIEFNQSRIEANKPPLKIGIGLHYGLCVSGIIGSEERLEYSVIGDTINACSRIEGMTKTLGEDILVTNDVKERAEGSFLFEEAESVKVRGKEKPLLLFKVKGYIDENQQAVPVESPYASYPGER